MCLVTACPKGTLKKGEDFESYIRNGFSTNTDGSGFAYKKKGEKKITLSKGYQSADHMIKVLTEADLTEDDELIIHHRIATSGTDPIRNTHPFVVAFDFEEITQVDCVTDKPVLAHNGMFTGYGTTGINPKYNDTVHWIHLWLSNPNLLQMLKDDPDTFVKAYGRKTDLDWNKIAMIFPDSPMIIVGGFTEDNGYYHSNACYKNPGWRDRGGKNTNFTKGESTKNRKTRQEDLELAFSTPVGAGPTCGIKERLLSPGRKIDGFEIQECERDGEKLRNIVITSDFVKLMPSYTDHYIFVKNKELFIAPAEKQGATYPEYIHLYNFPLNGNSRILSLKSLEKDYKRVVKSDYTYDMLYNDLRSLVVSYSYELSKSKYKKFTKILERHISKGKKLLILKDTKLIVSTRAFKMFLAEYEYRTNKITEAQSLLV